MLFTARSVIMNGSADSSYLLQLVEELCRHNDKIADDSKKDKDDLQNQVSFYFEDFVFFFLYKGAQNAWVKLFRCGVLYLI